MRVHKIEGDSQRAGSDIIEESERIRALGKRGKGKG